METNVPRRFIVLCPVCRVITEVVIDQLPDLAPAVENALQNEGYDPPPMICCTLQAVGFVCPECDWAAEFSGEQCRQMEIKHRIQLPPRQMDTRPDSPLP